MAPTKHRLSRQTGLRGRRVRPRRPVSRWAQGGGRGSRRTPWPPPRRSSGLGWRPRFEPDIGPPPAASHLGSLRVPFLPFPQVWSIDGAGGWGRAWRNHAPPPRCGAARAQVRPARAPSTPPGRGRREICRTPTLGISPVGGRRGAREGPRACPMYPSDSATLPDPPRRRRLDFSDAAEALSGNVGAR